MSILIKGIDMPKNGEITIAFASDENGENTIALILDANGKPIEHKGVTEIPTPHGYLIDKEPIKEFISDGINIPSPESYGYDGIEILSEIEFAPTTIEEEVNE